MTVYADVNGKTVTRARITIGATGPWFADCVLDTDAAQVTSAVTLTVGGIKLRGTVIAEQSGAYVSERTIRIVGGAGGWAKLLGAKAYHADNGVRALIIAQDAAREAGETLGNFAPQADRVGIDYVREAGPASRVLEDVIGAASWWVDYDGKTQVGTRSISAPAEAAYDVIGYDPRAKRVSIAADDLTVIGVGSVVSKMLEEPLTVRDLEIVVEASELVITAWCGPALARPRLLDLFEALVKRSADERLHGIYEYRVVQMNGDRADLQVVRKGAGLPDLSPISMAPGVAGAHAELSPGAIVYVQFVEGDRTRPLITGFAGKDGAGFVPVSLSLCGSEQAAARQGDLVQSGGPGTSVIFTGTGPYMLPGTPYLVSFSSDPTATGPNAAPLYGAIATGSPKVKA